MSSPRSTLVLEVLTRSEMFGRRYVIHPDQKLLLGRTRVSDLVIEHGTLSQRHAWIWFEQDHWRIRDAESTPGSFVDDQALGYGGEGKLPYGARLRLGGCVFKVTEGAPDLEPSIPPGTYPRFAGEAAEKAEREEEARRPPPPPPDPPFAGRFRLYEPIGRGNQGVVHRALDHQKMELAAVKIFDKLADDALLERFLSQEKIKDLRHWGKLVEILAWGVVDGAPYVAMEFGKGERLSDRLKVRPLTMKEAVELGSRLGFAAGQLHEAGFLHRNIKPENVRYDLPLRGIPNSPALSDIWIDTVRSGKPPYRPELLAASLGFAAPEWLRTGEADARSDVYSVAAIVYRCVAGCMPIADHDLVGESGPLGPSRSEPPQPLAELRPDAPAALCDLLEAALSPYPGDRPATGNDLAVALSKMEKTLGLPGEEPPFPIARVAAGRRAGARVRPPIDPITDEVLKEELMQLVVPRCQSDKARQHVRSMLRAARFVEQASPSGCALCGIPYIDSVDKVEMRPDGFFVVHGEDSRLRRPYLCDHCVRGEHRAAHMAFTGALSDLSGRDTESMRPGGPTRRELREGMWRLVENARPHFDDHAVCARCSRQGALIGTEMNLCPSCVSTVRAAVDAQIQAEIDAHNERVRVKYALYHARAEARLASLGKPSGKTPESDVRLPRKNFDGGKWTIVDIERLEAGGPSAQAEIDLVGASLASAIEEHVIAALKTALEKGPFASEGTQCHSGLPRYVERYLEHCRPSKPVADRLDLAIAVMAELLDAGYTYVHQVEDFQWQDATVFFYTFRELASKPAA